MLKINQLSNTFNQTRFASLLLVVLMLVGFGVVSLDNHHQVVNEVVAEAADIGEEIEQQIDDLPISKFSHSTQLFELGQTFFVCNQIAAYHNPQKYVLSPRAPPYFI